MHDLQLVVFDPPIADVAEVGILGASAVEGWVLMVGLAGRVGAGLLHPGTVESLTEPANLLCQGHASTIRGIEELVGPYRLRDGREFGLGGVAAGLEGFDLPLQFVPEVVVAHMSPLATRSQSSSHDG